MVVFKYISIHVTTQGTTFIVFLFIILQYIVIYVIMRRWREHMRVTTSKSKNSESFYITKGFINEKGVSTSSVVRKLGTLNDLLKDHGPTRDDVMAWAREQARLETEKYKKENEARTVLIPFHADRQLDYGRQKLYKGGYLFLQSVYYGLGFDRACRKIRERHKFRYDLNAILSDLIYTRILEPGSKRASYRAAMDYLENLPMKSMTSTVPWMSLQRNAASYNRRPSRTAAS